MFEDFISIHDLSVYEFSQIMDMTENIKARPQRYRSKLKDKVLAMIFQKPSLRTRMTFEVGMLQLGGEAVYLSPSDIQMGKRENPYDVGKNMERWVDGIMIRTFAHQEVIDLAGAAKVPVINALTDLLHPCQAMADFFTLKEKHKNLTSLKLAYVGDGNNVCHSLLFAAAKAGCQISVATPSGFEPDPEIVKQAEEDATETGAGFFLTNDPSQAVEGADAVYTDVWASMGQEEQKKERAKIFASFQVNRELMAKAKPDALFMHCLPAHRGEEVTDEVIDSPQSVVFDQAENRLHVQKIIMLLLMEKKQK
ncbi:MAG: ornithine carbamoyltransferase [Candidatus Aminicenantes bacterium]|nr:ornithine carbamoyltransferase [Candidatus Aminicenantes bacterium]MDH5705219.1 ornithine carbamoyltransferase [Candidatus Aminicenantes bacterium]